MFCFFLIRKKKKEGRFNGGRGGERLVASTFQTAEPKINDFNHELQKVKISIKIVQQIPMRIMIVTT